MASDNKDIRALDELFNEVGTYRNSTDLKELFMFIKRFPKIAPYNAFLLHIQKPGSQYVAWAPTWKQEFNRTIKPGARPLVMLKPFGPVDFVFELEDTMGEDPFPDELLHPFQTEGVLSSNSFNNLILNLSRDNISYSESDHGTQSAGFIQKTGKGTYGLVVNKNHSTEVKFSTIAHELGHLYCGHLGTPNEKWGPNRSNIMDSSIREFEAESVAWLVCQRHGLNAPSASYLSSYLNTNAPVPSISLETILKAARMIEEMAQKRMRPRKI